MPYRDVKKITFKIKRGGSTMTSSYSGSLGFKRPQSETEARQMAEAWIKKKYPGYDIVDLKVELR